MLNYNNDLFFGNGGSRYVTIHYDPSWVGIEKYTEYARLFVV